MKGTDVQSLVKEELRGSPVLLGKKLKFLTQIMADQTVVIAVVLIFGILNAVVAGKALSIKSLIIFKCSVFIFMPNFSSASDKCCGD